MSHYAEAAHLPISLTRWLLLLASDVPLNCHLYAGQEAPSGVCLIIPCHAPPLAALNLIILKLLSLRQVPHTVLFSPGEFAGLRRLCAKDTWHSKVWKAFKSPAFPFTPAHRPYYPFRLHWHSAAKTMAGGSLSSLFQSNTHTVPAAELLSSCTLRSCTHVAAWDPQLAREHANKLILKSTHPLAGMTQSVAQLAGAGVNFLANVPTEHPVTQTTAGAQNWKWMRYWLFCRWSKQHHLSAAGWHKAQRNQSAGEESEERGVQAGKMVMQAQTAIVAWQLATGEFIAR